MKTSNLIRSAEHYLMGFININDIEETNTGVICDKLTEERLTIAERNTSDFLIKIMDHALNYSKFISNVYCPLNEYPIRFYNDQSEIAENLFDSMITKAFEMIEVGQLDLLETKFNNDLFSFVQSCYYQGTMHPIPFIYFHLYDGIKIEDDRLNRFARFINKYYYMQSYHYSEQLIKAKKIIKELIKKSKLMIE